MRVIVLDLILSTLFFQGTHFGMVVAFLYCSGKYLKMFDDNNKRTLFSRPVGFVCLVFAVVAIMVRIRCNRLVFPVAATNRKHPLKGQKRPHKF